MLRPPRPPRPEFEAHRHWSKTYRIFVCHGFVGWCNDFVGRVCLQKHHEPDDTDFYLHVDTQIDNEESAFYSMKASLRSRAGELATVDAWTLTSDFDYGLLREKAPDVPVHKSGPITEGAMTVRGGRGETRQDIADLVTTDWRSIDAGGQPVEVGSLIRWPARQEAVTPP